MLIDKILKKLDFNHVNVESYQNYSKFYGDYVPDDPDFSNKVSIIYDCLEKKKIMDIVEIADKANCTVYDVVMKIRYLENKCIIPDYYIDTVNKVVVPCSEEDKKLLSKYAPYIYHNHMQIDEIAKVVPSKFALNVGAVMDEVFNELKYLDSKKLLNGIKIDTIDHKIIYYSLEKRKTGDYRTVHCPNCGALNDVAIGEKVRCKYCDTIVIL